MEEAIRNKQLVGPTSHVFNLLFAARPAVVRQNYNRPFNWHGKAEANDECVTGHNLMCALENYKGDRLPKVLFDDVLDVHVDTTNSAASLNFWKERQSIMTPSTFLISSP